MNAPYLTDQKIEDALLLASTYKKITGISLFDPSISPIEKAEEIYNGDFVLVAHGTESDPIFHYANKKAQELWEMSWEEFTRLPSRFSAEPVAQEERNRLLQEAKTKGYIDNYQGIRIAKSGKRFVIKNTLLWNVYDDKGIYKGQAALFKTWEIL